MTADMVHDLHYHVIKGKCWVVTLNTLFSCPEVGDDGIVVDTYIIADTSEHARYLASRLYPESDFIGCRNVTPDEYLTRRD